MVAQHDRPCRLPTITSSVACCSVMDCLAWRDHPWYGQDGSLVVDISSLFCCVFVIPAGVQDGGIRTCSRSFCPCLDGSGCIFRDLDVGKDLSTGHFTHNEDQHQRGGHVSYGCTCGCAPDCAQSDPYSVSQCGGRFFLIF